MHAHTHVYLDVAMLQDLIRLHSHNAEKRERKERERERERERETLAWAPKEANRYLVPKHTLPFSIRSMMTFAIVGKIVFVQCCLTQPFDIILALPHG